MSEQDLVDYSINFGIIADTLYEVIKESTGAITIQRTGTNLVQDTAGTTGITTTIRPHSAGGNGLSYWFTAINIGGVGVVGENVMFMSD